MNRFLFTLVVILSFAFAAAATPSRTFTLRIGQQKFLTDGKLTVRFVSVIEDSRCPINARCVWAGNAKIRLSVAKGRTAARVVELNTGKEPQVVTVYGHDFRIEALSPHPGERARRKTADISITKSKI